MEKYSSLKQQPTSPLKKFSDSELDPYSPVIVEDLLQGLNEWRNIQDIIRLTFKALTDVVKAQGEAIRELEKTMPTRASKSELNSSLSMKANVNDVSRTINEIANSIDSKVSFDDTQTILKDYVMKTDLQYLLSHKVSFEEIRSLLDTKVNGNELKSEISSLSSKVDDINRDISKKMNNLPSSRDIQTILETLEQKANLIEMQEALETKANKQSVATALHRKANRSDVDAQLSKKSDLSEIQNIMQILENKAEVRTIDKIVDIIDSKAEKQEMNFLINSLSNKIEKPDLDSIFKPLKFELEQKNIEDGKKLENIRNECENIKFQLNSSLQKKADSKDLDKIQNYLSQKIDSEQMVETLSSIKNEIYEDLVLLKNEITAQRSMTDETLLEKSQKYEILKQNISEEIGQLSDRIKQLSEERRTDIEETAKFVKNVSLNLKKEMEKDLIKLVDDLELIRKTMEETTSKRLDKKEFLDFRSKIMHQLEEKVDLVEVQNALNTSQSDLSARFIEYKEDIKTIIRNHESDVFGLLNKKANLNDVNVALSSKADNSIIQNILNSKIGVAEFENITKILDSLCKENEEKINEKEYRQQFREQMLSIDELKKDILLKANINDVCVLLDTKSNITDVNKALTEIHKELDIKNNQEDFNNYVNDQAIINESLCTENIVGRWTWKSGDLKSGSTIPWEMQVVNTLPDNFLWEKDKTSILTVAPGLYEVSFGFFAKKKPTVQLLVNGEPIISAVNNASYVIHHSSGKLKDVKHPYGNITGLTMIDFIVLPARARLSITYSGELGAEGFFGLRRL